MEKTNYIINRWKKRGIIKSNYPNEEKLRWFIDNVYNNLSHQDKILTGRFLKLRYKIENFSIDFIRSIIKKDIDTKCRQGTINFVNNLKDKEIFYKKRDLKCRQTRIKKYPHLTEDDALKQSYIDGIISKGKRIAYELGIKVSNVEEYKKLSGYTKKFNYQKLSSEEKQRYVLNWKKSNLKNIKVSRKIQTEYPNFVKIDVDSMSDNSIEYWYSTYMSINSTNNIINGIITLAKGDYYKTKFGNTIYCRSSLEIKVCEYLESIDFIVSIDTEPFHIKYKRLDENFERRYVPDFIITTNNNDNFLIEVKPYNNIENFMYLKGNYIMKQLSNFFIITDQHLNEKFYEYISKNCKYE